jgi:hypothetical protein
MTSMPERFGATGDDAGEHVRLVDRQPVFLHLPNGEDHAEHAEPVGHKPGDVPRDDDALSENSIAEMTRRGNCLRRRFSRRDDLQQVQIPRRIEEVHAKKTRPKSGGASLEQRVDRNARRVRRDDRMLGQRRFQSRVQRALRLGLFDDRFDHEIAVGEKREVVVRIADGNQRGAVRIHERGRLALLGPLETGPRDRVSTRVAFRRGHVEENHRNAGRRGERRDPAAHRPRPDHAEFPNSHSNVSPSVRRHTPVLRGGKAISTPVERDSATRKGHGKNDDECEIF